MFEQPPLTDREVLGRGFVMGLAAVFSGLILSVACLFWPSFKYRSPSPDSVGSDVGFLWLLLGTLLCALSFATKDEERIAVFRTGSAAAYGLFLLLDAACWLVKF
jgi:hypothetical protein